MPQFDFYSFSTQVFYVLLAFSIFHFLVLNYVVISYAQVLKLRQKLYNTYLFQNLSPLKSSKALYSSILLLVFKNFK